MSYDDVNTAPIPSYSESLSTTTHSDTDGLSLAETLTTCGTSLSDHHQTTQKPHYDILPSFQMHQSIVNRSVYTEGDADPESRQLPIYGEQDSVGGSSPPPPSSSASSTVEHLTREDSIMENIDMVPESNAPIEMTICITKEPYPACLTDKTTESPLKEYTSGEYLYGYYTLKNTSSKTIPFDQVTVTLEGNTTVSDPSKKKMVTKNFLRIFDLSAGHSHATLPISPHADDVYSCEKVAERDGYVLCLEHQFLAPGVTYKKFFTFRFPVQLLDQSCDQLWHLMLPPTFGVSDKEKTDIEFNNRLGYGRSPRPGAPVMMKDHAPSGVAIEYSVNVRVVGLNPNAEDAVKYSLLKKKNHHVRFIPYGFGMPFNYEMSTDEQLNLLYNRIEADLKEAERRSLLGITEPEEQITTEAEMHERKQEQLFIPTFPLPNKLQNASTQKASLDVIENKGFFGKSKTEKTGYLTIQSETPVDGIPYIIPKFVQRLNNMVNMNQKGKHNINTLDSNLSSTEKQNLNNIELELVFKPSKNSTKPPLLESIKVDLELQTLQSIWNIPFTLTLDFALTQENLSQVLTRFNGLTQRFKKLGPNTKISGQTVKDINALMNLKLRLDKIPLFKIARNESTPWKPRQDDANNLEWVKKVNLQLQVNAFPNLTLVPAFQNCIISRVYEIKVEVSFDNQNRTTLGIPVRVRKFDWQGGDN